ncbi:hypothetical protein BJF79_17800 [Actinomadura sp. CNU-125]|uniref:aromatic-ring hydroxylase C-terminal domain-containing protein n=1 Tax=Actinomadura sp. CNU-125 TaxID=1904961 RepID=UPI0009633A4B|nr:hypothetical protein [Actinomadura sp. CNU-125]OLT17407.1 hypothetical protein BJF79_17800 [Actinomadura sp. CNU-125]
MGGEPVRLRRLFGAGMVLLTDARRVPDGVAAGVPCRVLAPDEPGVEGAVVVRPDGHVAAALPSSDPAAVRDALRRACGY